MRPGIVEKRHDERVSIERLLNDPSLHAAPAAVDEAHFAQACGVRLLDVFLDDGGDVPWRKRMQVDFTFDGNSNRFTLSEAEGVLILHGRNGRGRRRVRPASRIAR